MDTLGGAYFDYDETAAQDGKADPSPFREGKVRTSLGGPGHFNSSPFNRALRLPQYIAPPEEFRDVIANLEKQVLELKEENIRLKNIMLISSPKALYKDFDGSIAGQIPGLMSPGGKLIYESPNRKSPVKRNQNADGDVEGEEDETNLVSEAVEESENDPTTARTVNSQRSVELTSDESSRPNSARPTLNLSTVASHSSPMKKKSYLSALTSPLKRENNIQYQSLSPKRQSTGSCVGPTDLQSDWAEDRSEPREELTTLLKTLQDAITTYGPDKQEVSESLTF